MKFTFGNLPSIGWEEPTGRLVELAQRAESVGFDRFGVSDWRYYQDCFVVMTACLTATTRLQLESLTTDPYVRHPSLTAAALATMDELAPGPGDPGHRRWRRAARVLGRNAPAPGAGGARDRRDLSPDVARWRGRLRGQSHAVARGAPAIRRAPTRYRRADRRARPAHARIGRRSGRHRPPGVVLRECRPSP